MLLSVILPIYNVENYLKQCIDSIINQTYKNIEVILVDDGSLDNSGKICDEYELIDDRIKVIHKENGGLSDARNCGVQSATGDYLLFVDSDDYIDDLNFFQRLTDSINLNHYPDVITHYRKKYFESTKTTQDFVSPFFDEKFKKIASNAEKINYLIKKNSLNIAAWLYVIKRDFFLINELFFKKGIVCEDLEWALRLYSKEPNIIFLDDVVYVYRQGRQGSITSTINEKNLNDLYNIIDEYSDKYKNIVIEIKLLDFIAYYYIMLCGLLIRVPDSTEKEKIIHKIKGKKWLLNYDFCYRVKVIKWLTRIFGIDMAIKFLEFFVKHIRR